MSVEEQAETELSELGSSLHAYLPLLLPGTTGIILLLAVVLGIAFWYRRGCWGRTVVQPVPRMRILPLNNGDGIYC
jgi:hypothetical protein